MLIQERVQLVMKMHNLSSAAFADKIGVQRSNISHILSGRNKPSIDMLEKILLNFSRVNAHWLITGVMPVNTAAIEDSTKEDSVNIKSEMQGDLFRTESKAKTEDENENEVEKIVTFYSDGTFKTHTPRN
jgi:transcriptional regulator with XRE-family HTH domain